MRSYRKSKSFFLALFVWFTSYAGVVSARADEPVSFAGKTVTIVIGSSTGGTTDTSARLMAAFLTKYLPGNPAVIVQNRPGSHSLNAMNYIAQQVKPDGLTLAVGSSSQIDPENYRVPQSHYDPGKFNMIGGVDLGGGIMIIRKEALPRLLNKSADPVVMGAPAGLPHSTMLMAAFGKEYLGWNLRWVSGYPSPTSAIVLALERNEIDMTGFSITGLTDALHDKNKYAIIYQTGSAGCSTPSTLEDIAHAPLIAEAVKDKITDPVAKKAFEYWCNASSTTVWAALPPGTPSSIINVYRTAFSRIAADPGFTEQGKRFSIEFSAVSHERLSTMVSAMSDISPEVTGFMPKLLLGQGLTAN